MLESRRHAAGICGGCADGMLRHAAQRHRRCATLAAMAALIVAMLGPRSGTAAPIEPSPGYLDETLLRFDGPNGASPYATLLMDGFGNLYGTTVGGGEEGDGAIFELKRTPLGWSETLLYSFCSQSNCADGRQPYGGLIMDGSGNLYGTTFFGGSSNGGVAFELTPPAPPSTTWTYTLLYNFCTQGGCADGNQPEGTLIMDASGNLYGTTPVGGTDQQGVVFQLKPNQSRTVWTESVLYNFCVSVTCCLSSNCVDSSNPVGGLIMDGSGNLYGTTDGGLYEKGDVFELSPPTPPATVWSYTELHEFSNNCTGQSCIDGYTVVAPLIMDAAGNLYGTTLAGGTANHGVVFELTRPRQSGAEWAESLLHEFAGPEGAEPIGGLAFGCAHTIWPTPTCDEQLLIGTTYYGGSDNAGTVFAVTPNESRTVWTEEVLHSFCSQRSRGSCSDGNYPYSTVVVDGFGDLYGATVYGGGGAGSCGGNCGTVFELVPPGSPVNPLLPRPASPE